MYKNLLASGEAEEDLSVDVQNTFYTAVTAIPYKLYYKCSNVIENNRQIPVTLTPVDTF